MLINDNRYLNFLAPCFIISRSLITPSNYLNETIIQRGSLLVLISSNLSIMTEEPDKYTLDEKRVFGALIGLTIMKKRPI